MNERFQKLLDEIKRSTKDIKILPSDDQAREKWKEKYDIPSESLLGVLLEGTGGIIIDNWIRFYGSGEVDFVTRNELYPLEGIAIAEDILGGLFVYQENGSIGYFAPDCLSVEDMEISLNQFLYWCLHGDTDTFYMDYRWANWREDVSDIKSDKGIAFYPFLWAEAESLESRTRKIMPIKEIIELEFDILHQLNSSQEEDQRMDS